MNSFDDIIQQKANDHKAPVPADAWDNIEKKERKKRRVFFFWWTSAALLLGLLIIGYYNYEGNKSSKQIVLSKTESKATNNEIEKIDNTGKDKSNQQQDAGNITAKSNQQQDVEKTTTENALTNASVPEKQVTGGKLDTNTGKGLIDNKVDRVEQHKKQTTSKTNVPANAGNKQNKTNSSEKWFGKDINGNNEKEVLAVQKKTVKKDKGKASIKTETGETGIATESKKENNDVAVNDTKENEKNIPQQKQIIDDKKELIDITRPEPVNTELVKKELAVDSTKTTIASTAPDENKKQTSPLKKKQAKKHAWFLDVAATPILPVQQYDKAVSFNRTLFSNNVKSAFVGNLVKTDINPSVAFSLSLRRSLSKKFFAGIGVQYLQLKEDITIKGTETNTKYEVVDRIVNGNNGPQLVSDTIEVVTGGERSISATNSYRFISIPVFVQYNFVQNRSWSLGMVAGTFINVFSNYRNEIDKHSSASLVNISQTIADKNKVSFSLYGGLRAGKMLGRRVEIFGLPSINWALGNQSVKNSMINKKIQHAGMSVGISYKLK